MMQARDSFRLSAFGRPLAYCAAILAVATVGALAQSGGSSAGKQPSAPQNMQVTGGGQQAPAPSFSRVIDVEIGIIEGEFVAAAEAMPESKFNFSPESLNVQGSDYKGVRTFAAEVKHVATANYVFWSPVTG